jgi:hypothetical protein
MRSALSAAEHLPRVIKLRADVSALAEAIPTAGRDAELVRPHKKPMRTFSERVETYYRLSVKVYEDEKALGVDCLRRPRKPIEG